MSTGTALDFSGPDQIWGLRAKGRGLRRGFLKKFLFFLYFINILSLFQMYIFISLPFPSIYYLYYYALS